jgi:putative SOS response-associated peptidase YedK
MCGRFTLRTPAAILKDYFGLPDLPDLKPRYNVAPTQPVGAIRTRDGERTWAELRWGLIPGWARDASIGSRMINARAETVATKKAFREAYVARRCVIPADGFYEWQRRDDGSKQPYLLTLADNRPFGFAGLWERWRPDRGTAIVESCTVITTQPNELVAPIHDRMPVLFDAEAASAWLDETAAPEALQVLLQPFPSESMRATPVSTLVNRPANDSPVCVEPVTAAQDPPRLF